MARPKKLATLDIDPEAVRRMASRRMRTADMAYILGCSADTIERRFKPLIDKCYAEMSEKILSAQMDLALDPTVPPQVRCTMLIYLGKVTCGQRDHAEPEEQKINATCTVAITTTDGRAFTLRPGKPEIEEFTSVT